MRPTRKMWEALAFLYAFTSTIILFWATRVAFEEGIPVRNAMGAAVCGLLWLLVAWARWGERFQKWDILVTMTLLSSIWGVMYWAP